MPLDQNPVQAFFRKFLGSIFLPTRTFEGLIDESPESSLRYAALLFLIFLPLKYLFLTAWQPAMSAIIPHSVFDNQRFQFCLGPSLLCNPLFTTGFYAVVIITSRDSNGSRTGKYLAAFPPDSPERFLPAGSRFRHGTY
jgi:hypothetical protein